MDNIFQTSWNRQLKLMLAVGFFVLSGLTSSYIFHLSEEKLVWNSLVPGLLFIVAALILFSLLHVVFDKFRLTIYCVTMYLTYLIVFFLTFYSSTLGTITGIFTTGIGSYLTFRLTDKFVIKIRYNATLAFILGGLSFVLNNLLLFDPITEWIKPIYTVRGWIHTAFAGPFLFWQVMVGIGLVATVSKGD